MIADRLAERGLRDGHMLVGIAFGLGVLVCGALGPIVPWRWLSLVLIAGSSFFSLTWVGAHAAILQLVTPNRMRGQISAIYQFVVALLGVGLGPTAVAAMAEHVFGRNDAVGWALCIVGILSIAAACLALQGARRPLVVMLSHRQSAVS